MTFHYHGPSAGSTIQTIEIDDDAITTLKIKDLNVTGAKIASGNIGFTQTADIIDYKRFLFRVVEAGTDVATGTTIGGDLEIPFNGTIVEVGAYNDSSGTTGTMVTDIHLNGTTIMTTDKLDIDSGEKSTVTGATAPALTTTAVSKNDILTIDVDTIHTTAAKGLTIKIVIQETT